MGRLKKAAKRSKKRGFYKRRSTEKKKGTEKNLSGTDRPLVGGEGNSSTENVWKTADAIRDQEKKKNTGMEVAKFYLSVQKARESIK